MSLPISVCPSGISEHPTGAFFHPQEHVSCDTRHVLLAVATMASASVTYLGNVLSLGPAVLCKVTVKSTTTLPLEKGLRAQHVQDLLWMETGFLDILWKHKGTEHELLLPLLRAHRPRAFQVCLAPGLLPFDLASSLPHHKVWSRHLHNHHQAAGERKASSTPALPHPSHTRMHVHTHTPETKAIPWNPIPYHRR